MSVVSNVWWKWSDSLILIGNGGGTAIFRNLSIIYCGSCGFGYSAPEIKDETIFGFYEHIFHGKDSPCFVDFPFLSKPISYDYRSLSQLVLARHFVKFNEGDSFLDIGPGNEASFSSALCVLNRLKMLAVELSGGAARANGFLYGVKTFSNIEKLFSLLFNQKSYYLPTHLSISSCTICSSF